MLVIQMWVKNLKGGRNALQNFLYQPLCLPSKSFIFTTHFICSAISAQNSAEIIEDPKTTAVLSLPRKGFSFSSISYSKLLSQCILSKNVIYGMEIHAHVIRFGLSEHAGLRNHVINLYSKCQCFGYARKMVQGTSEPDLVSWSTLISGYVQNGLGKEALSTFYEMHLLGIECNEFTLSSVLKACTMTMDLELGKQIHGLALVTGFESDVYVANTLVVLYAKCGEFGGSNRLFNLIPDRNVVSWNALFSCYVQRDFSQEAVDLFQEMVSSGIRPNEFSLSSLLNACANLKDGSCGKKFHGHLVKLGYDSDPFSANALVDMYAKVGYLQDAISAFKEISKRDIVSWNSVIAGCVLHEYHNLAVKLFVQMGSSKVTPNKFTLSSVITACAGIGLIELGRQLHATLIKKDVELDSFLGVGLIDLYSKCDRMSNARMVYNSMPTKDSVALNAVMSGHSNKGEDIKALSFFEEMYKMGIEFNHTTLSTVLKSIAALQASNVSEQVHALSVKSGLQSDIYVANSLLDAYGKSLYIEAAEKIFEECGVGDLVAFTSMITAYSQCGQGEEALKLYLRMLDRDIKADAFACSSLLNACANLSAYEQGKQIHVHVLKLGLLSDIFAGNSLVNMYAKSGSIGDAGCVFVEIPKRGIVSWSAMIGGLAQHGHGKEALRYFHHMLEDGILPNHITLVSVLCACNHAGLLTEARRYFESMEVLYGISPTQEHYACMIDLLGRAGKLNEAMQLISSMPFEANAAVWGALLGASRIHRSIELGRLAAEKLLALEPGKSGTHVLLANIYASVGMWENVAKVRRLMKDSKVKKEPGMSWMEVKDKVYTFIVGDRSHSRCSEIYAKLDELSERLKKGGYVPMIDTDLHDVEQSEKEQLLLLHSEKLAVAFGLIATPSGSPIRVKKNLRVCVDCHTAFKFICKIESREIIIRDINRFHHFRDGSCSCGDYW